MPSDRLRAVRFMLDAPSWERAPSTWRPLSRVDRMWESALSAPLVVGIGATHIGRTAQRHVRAGAPGQAAPVACCTWRAQGVRYAGVSSLSSPTLRRRTATLDRCAG